jgi:SOS-response transcriptional repressor LexA
VAPLLRDTSTGETIMKIDPARVFEFIRRYYQANQETPTNQEIRRQFGLNSSGTVHGIIRKLEQDGKIEHVPNVSRGIRLK